MSSPAQTYEAIFVRELVNRTGSGEIRWRHVVDHGMFVTTVGTFTVAVTQRHLTNKLSDLKAAMEKLAKRKPQDGLLVEALLRGVWGLAQASGSVMYLAKAEGEVISIESPEVTNFHESLTQRFPGLSRIDEELAHRGAKQTLFADTLSALGWLPTQPNASSIP